MTRKELVKKLAEHLEVTSAYLGAPTFAYQVGDYTVDRHGRILDGEGRVVGLDALLTGTSPEANGKEEVGLEIVAEPETVTNLEVELPLEGYQGQSLRNLLHVIYSRQPLIKKSLGLENDLVDSKIITALTQKPMVTVEHFQKAMEGHSLPGIDIDFEKETITFKLGPGGDNPGKVEAATKLFGLINLNARRLKRNVSSKVKPVDNEKYSFRIWLLRLGMIGDEYKMARKVLLKNLSGNSAFRRPVKGKRQMAKPKCKLIGEDGNIFNLMGIASRTLKKAGLTEQAEEMIERIKNSGSYYEALGIIMEYLDVQ